MKSPITIHLNGSARSFVEPMSLACLLEVLGMGGKPLVVELNESAVFPKDYATRMVEDDARVEVVVLAAGG